jgi:uncharacterized protein with PIN domain
MSSYRKQPVTHVNKEEFFKHEYKERFDRIFGTYEEFKHVMELETTYCTKCKCLYWKGTTPPCECRFSKKYN